MSAGTLISPAMKPMRPDARAFAARMSWMSPGRQETAHSQRPKPPWAFTASHHSSM